MALTHGLPRRRRGIYSLLSDIFLVVVSPISQTKRIIATLMLLRRSSPHTPPSCLYGAPPGTWRTLRCHLYNGPSVICTHLRERYRDDPRYARMASYADYMRAFPPSRGWWPGDLKRWVTPEKKPNASGNDDNDDE